MSQTRPEKLSRREREIMNVLFSADGGMGVEDVRNRLSDPPTYSAVRAMLAKLEAKGHIRHREEGLRYVYEPTTPRTAARKSALGQMVDVFFGGSPIETASALLKHTSWTNDDLDTLSAAIDKARKERTRR
jgi:predicted transcriptional regulator